MKNRASIKQNEWIRKICSRLTPEQTTVILASGILALGIAFLCVLIKGASLIGERGGKDTLKIEHIDSVPIPSRNDTITLIPQSNEKG